MKYNKKVVFSILAVVVVVGIGFAIWHLTSTINRGSTSPVETTDGSGNKTGKGGENKPSSPGSATTPGESNPANPAKSDDATPESSGDETVQGLEIYPGVFLNLDDDSDEDERKGADQSILAQMQTEEGRERLFANAEEADESTFENIQEEYDAAMANVDQTPFVYDGTELSLSIDRGVNITVKAEPASDGYGLVIKPHVETAFPSGKIGYYVRGNVSISNTSTSLRSVVGKPYNSPEYEEYNDFFITFRCFDSVIPVETGDVRWNTQRDYDNTTVDEDTLYLRVLDMRSGRPLGVFSVTVKYDETANTYRLAELKNCNLLDDPTLPDGRTISRERLNEIFGLCRESAEEYLLGETFVEENPDWYVAAKSNAVISYVGLRYHNQFITPEGSADTWSKHNTCVDIFAVSFSVSGYAALTFFVVPTHQYEGSARPAYNSTCDLMVAGREPLFLFSQDTMIVPSNWDTVSG